MEKGNVSPVIEILLENTDNLELFKAIGLEPGKAYFSPVNNERKPSTYVYYNIESKKYLFKDFSSGKGGGPVEYVALKHYDGNKNKAKQHIADIILNHKVHISESKTKIVDIFKRKIETKSAFIETKENYFTRKFGILPDKLSKYGILWCVKFVIDNVAYQEKHAYLYVNHRLRPMQIYRAYKKENKHINLTTGYEYHYINNKSSKLIICGSIKDGIVASHIFDDTCDVICLLNENYTPLSKKHLLNAKKNIIINKYKKVYLLFDNDATGKSSADTIKSNHPYIDVPDYTTLYGGYKDISDFVEQNISKSKTELWKKLNL